MDIDEVVRSTKAYTYKKGKLKVKPIGTSLEEKATKLKKLLRNG